jgi:hypothetical protein
VAIWQEQNVNFGYDQDAWRAWLADQQGPATATLRRDD